MIVCYVNTISEDTLSVQMKDEVERESLSAKWMKNMTRSYIVLLIPGKPELLEFLILDDWLLRYCGFCENM